MPFTKMGKVWVEQVSLSCQPDIQVEKVSRELVTKFKGEIKLKIYIWG